MVSQCEYFHEALRTKYTNKDHIQKVQHIAKRLRLLIVVHGHRQHVEADEQHDNHVEFFVGDDFEDYRLGPPLFWKEGQTETVSLDCGCFFWEGSTCFAHLAWHRAHQVNETMLRI